ncbi:hypothetical protein COLO4_34449 [Corchorus olitorius]|uniref:Uncharacterized protein n=1 Tax=Corchorus olitorius TaxID=93759 RepID=A0A1R3GKL1_9ROSI|nr:hypothetical protein COLO4_34449 [Corchorus olitorius]
METTLSRRPLIGRPSRPHRLHCRHCRWVTCFA